MKYILLFFGIGYVMSCGDNRVITMEKREIQIFLDLVSKGEFDNAKINIITTNNRDFSWSDNNFKLLQDILIKSGDNLKSSVMKTEVRYGEIEHMGMNANYYKFYIPRKFYDTVVYSKVYLIFIFDRTLKINMITDFDFSYDQNDFIIPTDSLNIKNIFSDSL